MERCDAPSLGPFGGGASFISRGDMVSAGTEGHRCARELGHLGPHAKDTITPLSDTVGMWTRYLWNDEHTLSAEANIVPIETSIVVKTVSAQG